jgi:hypothetical protein
VIIVRVCGDDDCEAPGRRREKAFGVEVEISVLSFRSSATSTTTARRPYSGSSRVTSI